MELKDISYRMIVEKAWFDINAGQRIDGKKTLKETIDYVFDYVNNGNKGCCFHASVYLMKLLHVIGIESEIILTIEPTVLENGKTRVNLRTSVLVKDGDKCVVMNPIEDIEFFDKNAIPSKERNKYYDSESTILKGEKSGIHSKDAANIDLEDFIKRYGNGKAWTLGSFYRPDYDKITFDEFMYQIRIVDLKNYTSEEQNSL